MSTTTTRPAWRGQAIALLGVVERNSYLVKRYGWWELAFFAWTVANTLTIVFIAKGVEASGGSVNVNRLTTVLLIGAVARRAGKPTASRISGIRRRVYAGVSP